MSSCSPTVYDCATAKIDEQKTEEARLRAIGSYRRG